MTRYGPTCELMYETTEDPELEYLRGQMEKFDKLFDRCCYSRLSDEDQQKLSALYDTLTRQEYSHWEGVSDRILVLLQGRVEDDFPMLRYKLGMLPIDEKN